MVKIYEFGSKKRITLKSLRPLFPLCKIFGILPYTSSFTISKFWFIYSIFISIVSILYNSYYKSYFCFFFNESWIQHLSTKIMFFAWSFLEISILASHLFKMVFSRKKFDIILRSVHKLSTKCVKQDFKLIKIVTYVLIVYSFQFALMAILFPRWDSFTGKNIIFSSQWTYILVYLIVLNFCAFCQILINQIDDLIQTLNKENARECLIKYKILLRLSILIIDVFSIQLLSTCVLASLALPMYIHFDISLIYDYTTKGESDPSGLTSIIAITLQVNWDLALIFLLCTTCSKAKTKSMEFNYKLFKVMKKNQILCSDKFLYSYMTSWEIMKVKPYGLVKLENAHLTSLIGSTTTYLGILLQFTNDEHT